VASNRNSFIAIPHDLDNTSSLRRFLSRLVEQLDVAFGYRGVSPFASTSLGSTAPQFLVVATTLSVLASGPQIILVDASAGPVTITLPNSATLFNARYVVKKIDTTTNPVTVAVGGANSIDGQPSWTILTPYDSMSLVPYLNLWSII